MKHLKLFFALFAMLALGVINAWGAEVTFSWAGASTATAGKTDYVVETAPITLTFAAGTAQNAPRTNKEGSVRMYASTTLTISCASGNITKVTFTPISASYNATKLKYNGTALTSDEWTLSSPSNEVTLTASANARFKTIVVTYTSAGSGETTEPEPEPDPDPTPDPEPEPDPTPDPGTGGESGSYTWDLSKKTYTTGTNEVTWTCSIATMYNTGTNATNYLGADANNRSSSRFYNGNTLTITPASNISISSVVFIATSTNYAGVLNNSAWDNASASVSSTTVTITPTNGTSAISATIGGTCGFTGVTVNYTKVASGEPEPEKTATSLVWSQTEYAVTMGETPTFPTLITTPIDLTGVTYSSSNETVATITTDGTITINAAGETTIKASYAGNEIYAAATDATYKLIVNKAPTTETENVYVKVTSTEGITNGEYLIVYEDAANNPKSPVAFNGALATLDAAKNTVAVAIDGSTIAGNTDIDAALFTIDVTAGTLKSASGKYIGVSSNSNGLKTEDVAKDYKNAFSVDNGNAVIAADFEGSTMSLRYNNTAGDNNLRFRYYKNAGQQPIALYKKASSHTLTYGTCTNGSVSANVADGATVLSGTTITLSNTPTTDYKLAAYDVYKTGDNTTKVTVTDGKFIMPEFDVTISATFEAAKTLTSIEITSAATQTTFWQGETFNYTGLEVTAHFDGAEDEDVTSKITVTGSTATAGTQTVTISYKEGATTKTATYNITVKAIPNTQETAYTVADAFDIIDKLGDTDKMYITGFVSQADLVQSTIDQYKNADYWISADGTTNGQQLEAYRGKYLDNADFTSVNQIMVGDEVIIYGKLTKYNSTYEFAAGNYLVSIKRDKQQAGLSYTTTEYNVNLGDAFTAPTLTNPNGLTVAYSTSDATLAIVDATTGAVTILDKAGKVTITATFDGNAAYLPGTASYNITITDPNQLEATFDATVDLGNTERGEGEITKSPITFACIDGILGNSSEYRLYQNATISFTAENGYAITKVVITSTASGTSQYGPGHLSTENGTYSVSDKTGTWVGEAQTVTFTATAQSRAKLITVYYKADNRQDAGLAWSTENVSITLGDAFTAPTLSNPNGLTLTCTSDNENLATVTNAGVVTLKSGVTGKATITAKFDGNSNYKDATVTCTITVNPKTEIVVILAQYNGQWYALKNVEETAGKVLAALEVTYFNGTLYNVADADKATIEWQRAAVTDGIIFKNGENYIYGTAGSTDLKLSTTECAWILDGSTYKIGNRTFIYNETANGFKNYNTSNAGNSGYSALPVVTAPVYATGDIVYTRDVTPGNYGTICLPYASDNFTGATFFKVAGKEGNKIVFDEVTTLEAGKPYIFLAEATKIKVVQIGEAAIEAGNHNSLQGTFTQINPAVDNVLVDNYMIVSNVIKKCGVNCGLQAYRAYFIAGELESLVAAPALAPGVRRVSMGVTGQNTATGVDQVQGDEVPTKMIINGQLFILRGEKMYDAQGKLVK